MEGLGARGQAGKRGYAIQRAKCQFCPADAPPVTAKHYRTHGVDLQAHAYSSGLKEPLDQGSLYQCRHCATGRTYSPHTAIDHLIGSHADLLPPVQGSERLTQHMPPVAEPPAVPPAFVTELAIANQNLHTCIDDLVDLVAKLEAEVKELKAAQKPTELEGLAAKLFKGWSERGAEAFYDK